MLRLDIPLERLDGMRVARGPIQIHVLRRGDPPWSFVMEGPGVHAQGRVTPGSGDTPPRLEVDHLDGEDEVLDRLFLRMADLMPPATLIMILLKVDPQTAQAVQSGVPLPCSRLGAMMWRAGARWSKASESDGPHGDPDWVRSTVPVDEGHRRQIEAEARADARRFLDGPLTALFPNAALRARALVEEGEPGI